TARLPIWYCSGWGLPSRHLLPRPRCALTAPFHPCLILLAKAIGGLFSVALSIASRRPAVSRHPALRSPDFPPLANASGDCPADFTANYITQVLRSFARTRHLSAMRARTAAGKRSLK